MKDLDLEQIEAIIAATRYIEYKLYASKPGDISKCLAWLLAPGVMAEHGNSANAIDFFFS
jgi:hypothetical protein